MSGCECGCGCVCGCVCVWVSGCGCLGVGVGVGVGVNMYKIGGRDVLKLVNMNDSDVLEIWMCVCVCMLRPLQEGHCALCGLV